MFSASVVITTKNRKEELLKAIESAMGQRGLLEVIVIDDGSTDGTAEAVLEMLKEDLTTESTENTGEQAGLRLADQAGAAFSNPSPSELMQDSENTSLIRSAGGPASLHATSHALRAKALEAQALDPRRSTLDPQSAAKPLLRLIRHEESRGLIVRRNEGARLAKGDVIFSLDDDAVFSSPFVVEQTLRDFSHPRIGAVAIPYIEPHKANKEMQRAPTGEDIWITASYIGTAHAVRRDVFLALGGYREHLVHQGEEGDFCIRMLATELKNEAGLTTEHTEGTEDEAVLTIIERQGGREMEQPKVGPKGEGMGTTESKITEGLAGRCLDKPSGDAFSKPSISKLARDSENTALTRSTSGPALERIAPEGAGSGGGNQRAVSANGAKALDHRPSTLDAAPLSAVQGFFVRLGNSDPIIHNESPKRDYSRMDFYGRRNDVLFHWQNTPMPDLLWNLPMTIAGGLVCAYRVKRWRKMLEGIGGGFLAIVGGVKREPVSRKVAQVINSLKKECQILLHTESSLL